MASTKESDNASDLPSSPKNVYKDPDDGRQRFLLELEFVQCLANPTYIHYLAQNRYFEDEAFIGYLKYLQYWQRPEYIKFIMYPHCLYFLELLQNANFRNAMAHPANKEVAHRQQFFFWKNYRNNRLKFILPKPPPEEVPTPAPPPPASAAPQQSLPASNIAMTTAPPAPASTHSPMPYGLPSGSALAKNDMRNSGIDRRKRKHVVYFLPPQELLRTSKKQSGEKHYLRTTMASIAISASLQRACSSHHVTKKQHAQTKPAYSLGTKQAIDAVTIDVEGQKGFKIDEKDKPSPQINNSEGIEDKLANKFEIESSARKFSDKRWKNGTWDLNMFVRNGRMDWDSKQRGENTWRCTQKLVQTKNQSSLEAQSYPGGHGRAAMIGFFSAYVVDGLTGMDLIGQTGNFICKTALFMTVIGIVLLRKTRDFDNLRKLADEVTYYDKQWQASWKDETASSSDKTGNS
ncbi:hypothetical protein CXB51_018215 [Gossypium anomalum]|uniref:Mediator of RNA polymerase II transcription subunit 31 n=2 Tax=Pentapetalae TaxID=1437201 RepID=A0A8J5Z3F9_9ROSI|nr:hypothetical protein CXB51_018215 [Gossypium anomalum]